MCGKRLSLVKTKISQCYNRNIFETMRKCVWLQRAGSDGFQRYKQQLKKNELWEE